MLLLQQTGAVKVGELVRYEITYDPSQDRILPSPSHLFVRIKNTSALPLRAAYLHGPYTLHAAVYPADFDPNEKIQDPRNYGEPQFDPNLKAGGVFSAKIPIPEELRLTGSGSVAGGDEQQKAVKWNIEVTSQILFSASASVNFEVLVSRDERSLDYNFSAISGLSGHSESRSGHGQVHDHQQDGGRRQSGHHAAHTKGVFSKAIKLVVNNTESLWNTPPFPKWEEEQEKGRKSVEQSSRKSADKMKQEPKKKTKIHLVILTHGLHSNLSADMLYLKESIDATAKEARESKRKRKAEASGAREARKFQETASEASGKTKSRSTDSTSEDPAQFPEDDEGEDDEDEEMMVRGFTGNAVKTENGIQYLGKRMAKWILDITYPDQPYKPLRKSMSQKLANAMGAKKTTSDSSGGKPTHEGSTIMHEDISDANLAYTFSSISFIGHSLGGLIQLYAIGYIQKHAPHFFDHIKPVNFICMASPLLGLSNENPMYVKFALDFGLVGRTGQDLGLTWKPPALAKSGWSAMGFGSKDTEHEDPGAKPLLRILPTGPAHRVLRQFRNRTVYSNVVNDGIVPLRTSCLLFLDWRGLNKVEKARRENGIIGTVASWGWSELTGSRASPSTSSPALIFSSDSPEESEGEATESKFEATVPQPAVDETNQDYQEQGPNGVPEHQLSEDRKVSNASGTISPPSPGPLDGLRNFLGLTSKTTKKDLKMYSRSQTIDMNRPDAALPRRKVPQADEETESRGRPLASRGDSIIDDPNGNAPPKTSIFESAGDILNPPIPPTSWIVDPSSRHRTIFHDKVYHPEDIPPPAVKRPKTQSDNGIGMSMFAGGADVSTSDSSGMKVEEKIARAYHKDLSWRKVLVRLEPDAHNNMIVRRMFANAYGWPVVKHLCDTHFGDTYAARTRDEREPAIDRAKPIEKPVGEHGEHVKGQEDVSPPKRPASEMREAADELMPLRDSTGDSAQSITKSETRGSSYDSSDDTYYQDTTDDEDNKGILPRFWAPSSPIFGGKGEPSADKSKKEAASKNSSEGTSTAEIAEFLTAEPRLMEGHRGLAPTPSDSVRSTTDIGLKKSAEDMVATPRPVGSSSVSKNVAKSLGSPKSPNPESVEE